MRKLAIAVAAFAAAILIVLYTGSTESALLFGGIAALAGSVSLLLKGKTRTAAAIVLFSAAFGLLWLWGYTQVFVEPAKKLANGTVHITAEAADFPEKAEYGERLTVNIDLGLGKTKAIIYVYDHDAPEILPGDTLGVSAKFRFTGGKDGVSDGYYAANGYTLVGSARGEMEILERDNRISLRFAPKYLAKAVKDVLHRVFPDDVSPFAAALITGDKRDLNKDTELKSALSRTGASHIVAVSGMHLSFLIGFIALFFGKRKWSYFAAFPFVIVFMAMVGFTPSVVRAGVMQAVLLAARPVRREYDPVTSLFFALGIIALVNPYSLENVGLQLSFAATLGIILISAPLLNKTLVRLKNSIIGGRKLPYSVLAALTSTLFLSFGATAFTLPISALQFRTVSLMAPLTNLLIFWAVSLSFTGAIIACFLGLIVPAAGVVMGAAVAYPIRYVMLITKFLAKSDIASVSVHSVPIMVWIAMIYVLGIIFVLSKEKPRRLVLPGCIAVLTLCAALILSNTPLTGNHLRATAIDVGQGQSILFECGRRAIIVDCGSTSGENAGEAAVSVLSASCRGEIDALIITHYHEDHVNGVAYLAENIDVGAILLPEADEKDMDVHDEIIELATRRGIDIIYVTKDEHITVGDMTADVFAPLGYTDDNENGLIIVVSQNGFDVLITGDVDEQTEEELVSEKILPDAELLVVGHHGSKYSTGNALLSAVMPEAAVISVGENSYGHPSTEALSRLSAHGVMIYRTDMDGNISFRAE